MNKRIRTLMRLLPVMIATILLAAVSGCRSRKEQIAPSSATTTVSGYSAMVEAYKPWQRLRVPFTLRLISPKNFSISGTATLERGSSVYMSMRMLGMEVAMLNITADSLTLVEKMNRQYLSVPIAGTLESLEASIDNIEDMLTGRAFILGADSLTLAMQDLFTVGRNRAGRPWALTPRRQPAKAVYGFTISPTGAVENLTVETDNGFSVGATYTPDVVLPEHGAFASSILVSTRIKDNDLQLNIEWDFSRARWNDDVEPKQLNIGRGYKPINVGSLLKALPAATVN